MGRGENFLPYGFH